MNRINIFITFVATVLLSGCATYKPQYKLPPDHLSEASSLEDIDKSFYLIGNAGNDTDEASRIMQSLGNYIAENNSKDSYVLFLGNSFSPKGMHSKDKKLNKQAENSMQQQLDALKDFKGKIVVLPGNSEWKGGVDGLELEEDFLKERFDGESILQPHNGCPLEGIDISDEIYLLAFDTQWRIAPGLGFDNQVLSHGFNVTGGIAGSDYHALGQGTSA